MKFTSYPTMTLAGLYLEPVCRFRGSVTLEYLSTDVEMVIMILPR